MIWKTLRYVAGLLHTWKLYTHNRNKRTVRLNIADTKCPETCSYKRTAQKRNKVGPSDIYDLDAVTVTQRTG